MIRWRQPTVAGSAALSLFFCAALKAQHSVVPAPDNFGIRDGIDLWIPATEFAGLVALNPVGDGYWYQNDQDLVEFEAYVPLPQGAYVNGWRVFYYDDSGAHNLAIEFRKYFDDTTSSPSRGVQTLGAFTSSGVPSYTSHFVAEDRTIDLRESWNGNVPPGQGADFYVFHARMPLDAGVGLKGVRVFWHRQVGAAPQTATFNDVPTSDGAFQFVEALAASGITAGCSANPPLYCPDAPLTRRQMAVFLAKALGLHWPPF